MSKFKWLFRIFFILIFLFISLYIIFLETERYESNTVVLVKDLGKKQSIDLGTVLLGQGGSTIQDSKVLEIYIRSNEMFANIDRDFNLSKYYTSKRLDFMQRLYKDPLFIYFKATKENILKKYNENLSVLFDDPSGTLKITFIHSDPALAKKILEKIIKRSEETINQFSRENSEIALKFIKKQIEEKKRFFRESIKKLIIYQNAHHTIDPSLDVKRKIEILSKLEMELIKNEVDYESKAKTFNINSREMKLLKESISNIQNSIKRLKRELAGSKDGRELNINVFDFELLKNDMEFNKEIYRQTLINMEKIKVEVAQQAKHLVVVVKPTLSDEYSYPDKFWDILTTLVVLLFLYSIIYGIILIISNHQD